MRIKKDMEVPTVQVMRVNAGDEEKEEEEEITGAKSRPARKRAAKPDLKGKSVA